LLVHASIQPKNSLEQSSIIIFFLNRQILLMLTLAQEVHNELKKQSTTRQEKKRQRPRLQSHTGNTPRTYNQQKTNPTKEPHEA
jgi:hypothetical protein